MRPFEILLLLLLFLPLVWPLLPWPRPKWVSILPLSAVGVLILHLVFERSRWQMIPAYGLTAVLALLALLHLFGPPIRLPRAVTVFLTLDGLLLFALALALPLLLPVPKLLPSTGPYAIGTFSRDLRDESRPEIYTPDPDDHREVIIQVWYPATDVSGGEPAPYLERLDVAGPVIAEQFNLPAFLLDHINLTDSHAFKNVPAAVDGAPFPVIIFSHGLTGIRQQNTNMVNELVSHGYVVAAVDHTYGNALTVFPDGRVILYDPTRLFTNGDSNPEEAGPLVHQWADDMAFLLDQMAQWNAEEGHVLNGRLNLDETGVFGHSTGGGATLQFCLQDAHCQAGLLLDGWVLPVGTAVLTAGPTQPFMSISTPQWLGEANRERGETILRQLNRDSYQLMLANTGHYDFTDLPLLTPLTPQLGLSGSINSAYSLGIQNEYLLAFFDRYLKGEAAPLLDQPSPYPELTIERP